MKYGKYEYERVYLLNNNCLSEQTIEKAKRIKDKYLDGTNLRLRKVVEEKSTQYKLTQKEKLTPEKKGVLRINTLYISEAAFFKLNALGGFTIEKTRYIIQIGDTNIGVDEIKLGHKSLFIAEVEFDSELKMRNFTMPLNYLAEITSQKEYSGFELARAYSQYQSGQHPAGKQKM